MDIIASLVVIGLGAALAVLVASPRTAQSLDTFAAGFLPYRSAGWPRGVQEEEPVHWSWSTPSKPNTSVAGSGTDTDGPELIELAGADSLVATSVDRGRIVHHTEPHHR